MKKKKKKKKNQLHKNSTASKASTSSLTKKMEAATHAVHLTASRGDSQTAYAISFTGSLHELDAESEKWNGKPRLAGVNV